MIVVQDEQDGTLAPQHVIERLGAIAGPFIASALITLHDASGLYWFAAVAHLSLVAFMVYRYLKEGNQAEEPIAFGDALSAAHTKSQVYEEELGDQDAPP